MLGFQIGHINACDIKSISRDIIFENFDGQVNHFWKSLDEQVENFDACCCLCPEWANEEPDIGVIGTPCQPFSRQRNKRSADGSVRSHSKYETTFTDMMEWLNAFQPKTAIGEQVEGFMCPESVSIRTTPLERPGWGREFIDKSNLCSMPTSVHLVGFPRFIF